MTFLYIIYGLFCFGFGIAYGFSVKSSAWDKFGVFLIGTCLAPFLIGMMIHDYLAKYDE